MEKKTFFEKSVGVLVFADFHRFLKKMLRVRPPRSGRSILSFPSISTVCLIFFLLLLFNLLSKLPLFYLE